jgi:hypothetical protein
VDRDRLNGADCDYRPLLRTLVEGIVAKPLEAGGEGIEDFAICDDVSGNYLHYSSGWQNGERIYGAVIHLRLKGAQVIVEANWTDEDIVDRLIEGGVPPQAIVIGWAQPVGGVPVTAEPV